MLTEAVCHYWAGPGREHDAALAWAYDLTYWFRRGVGEQPAVTAATAQPMRLNDAWYAEPGFLFLNYWEIMPRPAELVIYHCRGLMSTTHPGDQRPVSVFDAGSAWSLDFSLDPRRQESLRQPYAGPRWDGR